MNDILKQRLVGALILVALGVVFWPIIFVEPGDRPSAEQARIPPRPEVNTSPIEPPDQVGLRPSTDVEARLETEAFDPIEHEVEVAEQSAPVMEEVESSVEALATPEATPAPVQRTREQAPEPLAMDSQGVPVAWILQVATISVPTNSRAYAAT